MADNEDLSIGIDLGTTNCCVAVYQNGRGVQVIPSSMGSQITPSHITINSAGEITIGDVAKKDLRKDLRYHFFDMKRLIGRRYDDTDIQKDSKYWPFDVINTDGRPTVSVSGHLYKPEEISALILKQLKIEAQRYLKRPVSKAVITVPAYFNSSQRQATKNAGKLAGLDVLSIINEPTAAFLAFHHKFPFKPPRNFLIFDLGGGTFDVAVISIQNDGQVKVLAVGGDTYLGGQDFDNQMVAHCLEKFKAEVGVDPLNSEEPSLVTNRRLKRLKNECEQQKAFLAAAKAVRVELDSFLKDIDLDLKITRQQFNEMNAPLFDKCIAIMDQVISSAKLRRQDIQNVIMVGGSTKIPEIRRRVEDYFNGLKLNYDINGDEAVAYGAALQAAFMTGQIGLDVSIQNVVPIPIGIDSFNKGTGRVEFFQMIPKNTPTPCSKEANFSARYDGQQHIVTNILEGHSHDPSQNHLVATFRCSDLPFSLSVGQKLTIGLSVDVEGILKISGRLDGVSLPDELVIHDFLHPVGTDDNDQHLKLLRVRFNFYYMKAQWMDGYF